MTAQLPQTLIRNSFNILGLPSSSTLKETRKRFQQLLQLAKIEEIQKYDIDIGPAHELRNESEVRLAFEKISNIKERLIEFFFWFDVHTTDSQKAISLISNGNYPGALDILEAREQEDVDWLTCKNLALTLLLNAYAFSDLGSYSRSMELWKWITKSEDFWNFYEKYYLLHDELGTSSLLFTEFRGSIGEILSANASGFYRWTKNPDAIGILYSTFGLVGKSIDSEVFQPIILKINKEIEDLEKKASNKESVTEAAENALTKIRSYFDDLDKFKLNEFSPFIVLRNNSSEKLRSISIGIYKQDGNDELALLFLEKITSIALSDTIISKIESDKKQIKENELWKNIYHRFEIIKNLITSAKFEEAKSAYLKLDNDLSKLEDEAIKDERINILIVFCSQTIQLGHKFSDNKLFGIKTLAFSRLATQTFEYVTETLTDRLYLLNFINPSCDRTEIIRMVKEISDSLNTCEITMLSNYHEISEKAFEKIANKQIDEDTQTIIKFLGMSVCYGILSRRLRKNSQKKIWKWVGWSGAIVLYFLVSLSSDKSKPHRADKTSSPSAISCSTPSNQSLTREEKEVIEYLQKNEPKILNNIRKEGYSDKQIARYVIEHANDEEE